MSPSQCHSFLQFRRCPAVGERIPEALHLEASLRLPNCSVRAPAMSTRTFRLFLFESRTGSVCLDHDRSASRPGQNVPAEGPASPCLRTNSGSHKRERNGPFSPRALSVTRRKYPSFACFIRCIAAIRPGPTRHLLGNLARPSKQGSQR
jgi:hypothetical protein